MKTSKKNEKAIKDIIKRYGPNINLEETPYVLVEIIRNFGSRFDEIPDGGLPCGGVPTPPPPPSGPEGRNIRQTDIVKQLQSLTALVSRLDEKIDRLSPGKKVK